CGPGTFVTTTLNSREVSPDANLAAAEWMVGGANPDKAAKASAPTARPDSLCAFIAYDTWCRRMTGLASPTGRSTKYDDTRLPSGAPSSSWTLTGTIARTVLPDVTDSPLVNSQMRSAPVTVASRTSLTLPPCAP